MPTKRQSGFILSHNSLGSDLTADDAEVGGNHGLTGNTGQGVLGQAGIQNGIGNGVSNLVGVAIGNAFGGKESFFHDLFLSFYMSKTHNTNKNRTGRGTRHVRCIESSSLVCRRIWHLSFRQVAGFHRAVPSTALDKAVCNFLVYSTYFSKKVNSFFNIIFQKMFTILLWTFCPFTGRM